MFVLRINSSAVEWFALARLKVFGQPLSAELAGKSGLALRVHVAWSPLGFVALSRHLSSDSLQEARADNV